MRVIMEKEYVKPDKEKIREIQKALRDRSGRKTLRLLSEDVVT